MAAGDAAGRRGRAFRLLRELRGLGRDVVATQADIHPNTLQRLEAKGDATSSTESGVLAALGVGGDVVDGLAALLQDDGTMEPSTLIALFGSDAARVGPPADQTLTAEIMRSVIEHPLLRLYGELPSDQQFRLLEYGLELRAEAGGRP